MCLTNHKIRAIAYFCCSPRVSMLAKKKRNIMAANQRHPSIIIVMSVAHCGLFLVAIGHLVCLFAAVNCLIWNFPFWILSFCWWLLCTNNRFSHFIYKSRGYYVLWFMKGDTQAPGNKVMMMKVSISAYLKIPAAVKLLIYTMTDGREMMAYSSSSLPKLEPPKIGRAHVWTPVTR